MRFPSVFLALTLIWPVCAAAAPKHPASQDAHDIRRVEQYLNARQNISARFIQSTDSGAVMTGAIAIKRPGKMNLRYDPPIKDYIIADGSFVYLWDGELQHSTTVPVGDSLADLILRTNVRLTGGDITVLKIERSTSMLRLTVQQASDPGNGRLTLMFEDYPMILHGWIVEDAQGRTTTVALQDVRENAELPDRDFVFTPPGLGKSQKSDRTILE